MNALTGSRIHTSLLADIEKRCLVWMAHVCRPAITRIT